MSKACVPSAHPHVLPSAAHFVALRRGPGWFGCEAWVFLILALGRYPAQGPTAEGVLREHREGQRWGVRGARQGWEQLQGHAEEEPLHRL